MSQKLRPIDAELEGEQLENAPEENQPRSGRLFLTGAPWWVVSVSLHALVLAFVALITWTLVEEKQPEVITVFTSKTPVDLPPKQPPQPTDAPIEQPINLRTPQTGDEQIVNLVETSLAELIETKDTDNPNDTGARGDPKNHALFPDQTNDPEGGGGKDAPTDTLYDAIGTSGGTPGSGDGWGTGNGNGVGVGNGNGNGGFGDGRVGHERLVRRLLPPGLGTENAVSRALAWLARNQEADGHWDCVKHGGKQADVAVSGLALLAFLGQGHTEKLGKYKDVVSKACTWLRSQQNADGSIYKQGDTHGVGYHHAIGGLALVEAAAMHGRAETVTAAQKAIEYTEKHQEGDGSERKGWRYGPKTPGDMSVSGWFIMQLKSAKLGKLKVDGQAFDGAIKFLDSCEQKGNAADPYSGHRYGYTDSNNLGYRTTTIGCLCRIFLGWNADDVKGGFTWAIERGGLPQWDANGSRVDLYYWYYASLTAFQLDFETFKRIAIPMMRTLVENQRKGDPAAEGSWDPVGAYSEYWGRVGQTALGALCLEVVYRYPRLADLRGAVSGQSGK